MASTITSIAVQDGPAGDENDPMMTRGSSVGTSRITIEALLLIVVLVTVPIWFALAERQARWSRVSRWQPASPSRGHSSCRPVSPQASSPRLGCDDRVHRHRSTAGLAARARRPDASQTDLSTRPSRFWQSAAARSSSRGWVSSHSALASRSSWASISTSRVSFCQWLGSAPPRVAGQVIPTALVALLIGIPTTAIGFLGAAG
jgi:hypothetical protein